MFEVIFEAEKITDVEELVERAKLGITDLEDVNIQVEANIENLNNENERANINTFETVQLLEKQINRVTGEVIENYVVSVIAAVTDEDFKIAKQYANEEHNRITDKETTVRIQSGGSWDDNYTVYSYTNLHFSVIDRGMENERTKYTKREGYWSFNSREIDRVVPRESFARYYGTAPGNIRVNDDDSVQPSGLQFSINNPSSWEYIYTNKYSHLFGSETFATAYGQGDSWEVGVKVDMGNMIF